jgi:hypothetical protein
MIQSRLPRWPEPTLRYVHKHEPVAHDFGIRVPSPGPAGEETIRLTRSGAVEYGPRYDLALDCSPQPSRAAALWRRLRGLFQRTNRND